MRAPWFDGIVAGAALALSLALVPIPAAAQQSVSPPSLADLSSTTSAIEARVPLPDLTELPPPTAADFGVTSAIPADTPSTTASVGTTAVETATPPRPAVAAVSTAPTPSDDAILRGIPVPEPAGVAPPTMKDIGAVPLAPADAAVAEKLKELTQTRLDRFVAGKRERTAVEDFYKARAYAPLWLELGTPSSRMTAAITRLKAADGDGLDANDYPTPDLKVLGSDPDALAQAELKLTNSVLIYARQAQAGRVSPSRISPNMEFAVPTPEPANVLKTMAEAKDVAKALAGFNPPHDGFIALKAKLAELRGAADDQVTPIAAGRTLKRGMEDKRVPLVRERLGLAADAAATTYDRELADAVKAFQKQKGLKADGLLHASTVDALNGRSRSRDIDTIISNMERWRWLPRDIGKAYVMVNVPDFTLKVVDNHKTLFHTRIVVGKPNTPSPSFSAAIENILVNPTWHVPQSIIYNEYLPALEQDPGVLTRMGLVMERAADGSISIRQPPGERNALGRIKFNFPNRYQVYLHDTPDKRLFVQDRRAYSHGCMRVQNPTQFGEVLLSLAQPPELRYSADRLQRMFGSGEQWLNFKKKIPVHVTYMNAYVDDAGKLVIRDDLYGYDARVRSALRGEYMAIAERSQKVTPGVIPASAPRHARRAQGRRQVVQDQPNRGGFFFPWFQ